MKDPRFVFFGFAVAVDVWAVDVCFDAGAFLSSDWGAGLGDGLGVGVDDKRSVSVIG